MKLQKNSTQRKWCKDETYDIAPFKQLQQGWKGTKETVFGPDPSSNNTSSPTEKRGGILKRIGQRNVVYIIKSDKSKNSTLTIRGPCRVGRIYTYDTRHCNIMAVCAFTLKDQNEKAREANEGCRRHI
eukprot:scaffold618_cov175-Amphora_coffeaeformis.AAC.9